MALFSWRKKTKKSEDSDADDMGFLDHLEELRWHLVRSIIAVLLVAVVLFSYRQEVIGGVFMSPFKQDFITYRLICENFGQFCEQELEVETFETSAPDSLLLEGYVTMYEEVDSLVETPDTVVLDSMVKRFVKLERPRRQRMSMKVSVEDFLQNGKIKGFSVKTEQGSMVQFQATSPYEQFMKALFYAFFGGLIFAFPYVSWEIWRFIRPALSIKEVRKVRGNVAASSALFFFGILFGYFIILPFSVTFLSSFILFDEAENIWRIGDVVNFVLVLLFGTGFLFQLPVVVYYLSRMGILTPKFLSKYRKHAVVGILVIAAIVTPPDPMSQILIFFPLMVLYEAGIVISRRVERKRMAEKAEEEREHEEWKKKKQEEFLEQEKEKEKENAKEKIEAVNEAEEEEGEEEEEDDDEPEEEEEDDDDFSDLAPPGESISRD